MAATEAMRRASKKYDEKFDVIRFRVPAGERDVLKAFAEDKGISLNQFLNSLVDQAMEQASPVPTKGEQINADRL